MHSTTALSDSVPASNTFPAGMPKATKSPRWHRSPPKRRILCVAHPERGRHARGVDPGSIDVGIATGIPVQLSHHKAEGRVNWGKVRTTLPMMDAARANGIAVMTDQYPYTAFMTGLSVIILPRWVSGGTPEEVSAKLVDPETRAKVRAEILAKPPEWSQLMVGIARTHREAQGHTIQDLADKAGQDPVDTALDLIVNEDGFIGTVYFALCEPDVEAVMRDPHTMIGSDGVATGPTSHMSDDHAHPRSYGTFPRVLAVYVRDRAVLTLAEAIRRMTTLPASRIGVTDRGRLAPGLYADIVLFKPTEVRDVADFADPHRFAAGIDYVIVNGTSVIENGTQTAARPGRVLRRQAMAAAK